jgi:ribonuclease HI
MGEEIRMQCFFSGEMFVHPGQPITAGVVSFRIPDLDITFRAQFKGNAHECQYASLLALLEFVDLNTHLFKNKTLEIYSDSEMVVRQVNNSQLTMPNGLEPYRDMALTYRRKYPYNLSFVRPGNNPALGNHYSQPDA